MATTFPSFTRGTPALLFFCFFFFFIPPWVNIIRCFERTDARREGSHPMEKRNHLQMTSLKSQRKEATRAPLSFSEAEHVHINVIEICFVCILCIQNGALFVSETISLYRFHLVHLWVQDGFCRFWKLCFLRPIPCVLSVAPGVAFLLLRPRSDWWCKNKCLENHSRSR